MRKIDPETEGKLVERIRGWLGEGVTVEEARTRCLSAKAKLAPEDVERLLAAAARTNVEAVEFPTFETDLLPLEAPMPEGDGDRLLERIKSHLPAMEAFVRSKMTESHLDQSNNYLKMHNKRPVTLRCVAMFLAIHNISVTEQEGQSPRDRFIALSRAEGEVARELFAAPWDRKHYTALMRVIKDHMRVTTLVRKPSKADNKCGVYSVSLPENLTRYLALLDSQAPDSGPQV